MDYKMSEKLKDNLREAHDNISSVATSVTLYKMALERIEYLEEQIRNLDSEVRSSIAGDIWRDEQECGKVIRKGMLNVHRNRDTILEMGGKLSGLQRARDICDGILVRKGGGN